MAITLIVEDGTGLPNANAYVSIAALRQYCEERDIALPEDDDEVAKLIIRATDYIDGQEYCASCGDARLNPDQALYFPRTKLGMPKQLLGMTAAMCDAYNQGFDPLAITTNADLVTEETVGPITTKYADPSSFGSTDTGLSIPAFDRLLKQINANCSGTAWLSTVRV